MSNLLAEGLKALKDMQAPISSMVPNGLSDPPTNDQVARMTLGLMGEVFELAQEVGWKNWKQNPATTQELREEVAEEFADVLAFLGAMIAIIEYRFGIDQAELAEAYHKKSNKNILRFLGESGEEGYVGFYQT